MTSQEQAKADLEAYSCGMRTNNHLLCVGIERRYDLYGAPPETVSTVLHAMAEGATFPEGLKKACASL
jgi:hypothetical protein